jgi:hypothetical protein
MSKLEENAIESWIEEVDSTRVSKEDLVKRISKIPQTMTKKSKNKIHPIGSARNRALPDESFKNERETTSEHVVFAETSDKAYPGWPSPRNSELAIMKPAKKKQSIKIKKSKKKTQPTSEEDAEAEIIYPTDNSKSEQPRVTVLKSAKEKVESPGTEQIQDTPFNTAISAVASKSPMFFPASDSPSPHQVNFAKTDKDAKGSIPLLNDSTDNPFDFPAILKRRKTVSAQSDKVRVDTTEISSKTSTLATGGTIKGSSGWMKVEKIILKSDAYCLVKVTRLIDDMPCLLKVVAGTWTEGEENYSALLDLEYEAYKTLEQLEVPNLFKAIEIGGIQDLDLKYLCLLDFGGESLASISRKQLSTWGITDDGRDLLPSGLLLRDVLHVFTETARFLSKIHRTGMVFLNF